MTENTLEITNRTYTVDDITIMLGIGRNTAYKLVNDPPFTVLRIGDNIRVPREGFEEWLTQAS